MSSQINGQPYLYLILTLVGKTFGKQTHYYPCPDSYQKLKAWQGSPIHSLDILTSIVAQSIFVLTTFVTVDM